MKILNSLFFVFCSVVCLAQNYPPPEFEKAIHEGAESKITLRVKDIFGNPVSNASVSLTFSMGSNPGNNHLGLTSSEGSFSAQNRCVGYATYGVDKEGYYYSCGKQVIQSLDPERLKDGRWLPWNPTISVTLKPKINPIPMFHKRESVRLPQIDQPMGFDLKEWDWTPPYGKGKIQDIIVSLKQVNDKPKERRMSIVFPNPLDGAYREKKDQFSTFKSVYHADTNQVYQTYFENSDISNVFGDLLSKDEYLIFRIRCEADENGKLISALYGKLYGPLTCVHFDRMQLKYYLNTHENDTNIEFDGKGFGDGGYLGL